MRFRRDDYVSKAVARMLLNYVNVPSIRDDNTIWVTEVSGCLLRAFLDRVAPRPVEDLGQALRMVVGEQLHRFIQRFIPQFLEGARIHIEKQYILPMEGFDVRGRADIVIDTGEQIIVEMKTTLNGVGDSPLPVHVKQLQYYLNMADVDRGIILYIDIKGGKVIGFELSREKAYLDELVSRARFLHRCISMKGTVPRPEKAPYLCHGCPYYFDCYSGRYRQIVERVARPRDEEDTMRRRHSKRAG